MDYKRKKEHYIIYIHYISEYEEGSMFLSDMFFLFPETGVTQYPMLISESQRY